MRYIGKFGSDQIGRLAREELAAEGIDLGAAVQAAETPHRLSIVLVEQATGHRTIVRRYDPRIRLRPAELSREAVCAGRVLHLDGYEGDAAVQAARWARGGGVPVSVDAEESTEQREELFRLTDILIVGRRFGRILTGSDDADEILRGLEGFGPPVVGVTLGEEGSVLRFRGKTARAPGFPMDVVDTNGAGDVFHGAFLYGLLQGWDPGDILTFANAVSALKCRRLGGRAGIPRAEEVRAFLAARPDAASINSTREESTP
jgi:sulfofructose kinase